MKIIAGISNAHKAAEIEAYVNAGVDEFFLGYIPSEWSEEFGWELSNNRRETSAFQYNSKEQLRNVVDLIKKYDRKVFLTLNAHEYNAQQIKLLLKILDGIRDIQFDGYIVSNIALILELRRNGFNNTINISIGGGSNNIETLDFFINNFSNIGRVILPRKLTINEIEVIAKYAFERNIKVEAFGMGAYCVFNDEYCFTWHGASNKCFCQSPMYTHRQTNPLVFNESWKEEALKENVGTFYSRMARVSGSVSHRREQNLSKRRVISASEEELQILHVLAALTVCGLCAFQKFKDWGIEAVKLPLRGHYFKNNLIIIELAKKVINEQNAYIDYCKKAMNSPSFCSGRNCYYNYPYSL
jgi:U32 family peptidase